MTTETLDRNSNLTDQPEVETTPAGRLLAVWRDQETVFARYRSPDGTWGLPEQVITSDPGHGFGIYGIGQSDTGLAAIYVEDVELFGPLAHPMLLVQSAPGAPWVRESADRRP